MAASSNDSTSLGLLGLQESIDALSSGEVSSAEMVDAALARIEEFQPRLNAFRVVRHDAARYDAAEADRRRAAGENLPLLGIPVAIKDDTDLAGETTPFASRGDFQPVTHDAEIVRR